MKAFFVLFALTMTACGSSVTAGFAPPTHNQEQQGPDVTTPGFAQVLNDVLAPRCTTCHSDFSTYENAKAAMQSIRDAVATNRMPKNGPPLTADQKEILFAWIDAGGPQDPVP